MLPVDDEPRLIADVPNNGNIALDEDQIHTSDMVIESAIDALRDCGMDRGPIGLVGGDALSANAFKAIDAALENITWQDAQDILTGLRAIKSPAEIALLRQAAGAGSRTIEAMMAAAVPGASHGDIVAAGLQFLVPAGGILYNSFMASGRGGENPIYVKSDFPTWASPEPLVEGHWLRLGISGILDGYYFDVSRSKAIGAASNRQVDLFEAAIDCVEAGIGACKVGATAEQIARAGLDKQRSLGYDIKGVFLSLIHI